MLNAVPDIREYDISPLTGFMPQEFPLERLPDGYYEPWEVLAANLPSLILNKSIREIVDTQLAVLETSRLKSEREFQRAYSVLSFLTHAYVWGYNGSPASVLPKQLAKPYKEVSEHLDLPPVATYAGLVLWNFKPALNIPGKASDDVSKLSMNNFSTICTFTGSIDESWFYLVSCHFEIEGAKCLNIGLDALKAAFDNKPLEVISNLQKLAELIDGLGTLLLKMEEMCDPHVFYFRIRPFLAGWKNMKDFGLDGLIYDVDDQNSQDRKPQSYSGGSNAQSSLIQYFDTLLNVVHLPTGHRPQKITNTISNSPNSSLKPTKSSLHSSENNFMEEMKFYMPKKHRQFLSDLSKVNIIKDYVKKNCSHYPELSLSYDACLAMLKSFRDKHIQIVTRYIILPSRSGASKTASKTLRAGLAANQSAAANRGTGGTALLPFLKQCRDETGDPAAGSWGRRILTGGILNLRYTSQQSLDDIKKANAEKALRNQSADDETAGHW